MTNDNSQQGHKEVGQPAAGSCSSLRSEPMPCNPLDLGFAVTAEASGEAGEPEAVLFRPRLHFVDEDLVR
jgi:hypothetical protein